MKCTKYSGTTHQENGVYYWELELEFEVKLSKWNPVSLLDCGTVYIQSAALPPQPIIDSTGNPVTTPIPLKDGKPLKAGETPVYLDFTAYPEVDFAALLT